MLSSTFPGSSLSTLKQIVSPLVRLTTMLSAAFPGSNLSMYNGAKGGTTSSYMALCLHVRRDASIECMHGPLPACASGRFCCMHMHACLAIDAGSGRHACPMPGLLPFTYSWSSPI